MSCLPHKIGKLPAQCAVIAVAAVRTLYIRNSLQYKWHRITILVVLYTMTSSNRYTQACW